MRAVLLLLLVAPLLAQEGGGAGGEEAERLHMARLAFEARLKLADLLRAEGKEKEALAAYAQAAAIFEAVIAPAPGAAIPGRFVGRRKADASAVERALAWLAVHQDADTGAWDADGFMKHDPKEDPCDGKGAAEADIAVTGLATLAFLGAGYTDRGGENPYAANVRTALGFLIAAQKDDGTFTGSLRDDAIATLSLCEAFVLTRNPRYKLPAERGVAALARQQAAGAAWADDAAITAWCASAIASARGAGLEAPEASLKNALAWLGGATDAATGRVGREGKTERSTAAAIVTRALCGEAGGEAIAKGVALCAAKPPLWNIDDGTIDPEYWWFGSRALFRAGGENWRLWCGAMKSAIKDRQQATGSRAGSWDPAGVRGGRVEATALMTMSLEIQDRHANATGVR